jgi:hypothetical protein
VVPRAVFWAREAVEPPTDGQLHGNAGTHIDTWGGDCETAPVLLHDALWVVSRMMGFVILVYIWRVVFLYYYVLGGYLEGYFLADEHAQTRPLPQLQLVGVELHPLRIV